MNNNRSQQIHIPVNTAFRRNSSHTHQTTVVSDSQNTLTVNPHKHDLKQLLFKKDSSNLNSIETGDVKLELKPENNKFKIQNSMTLIMKKLGGEEIGGIKKKMILFLIDWILDLGTAIYHFANGSWIPGALTYIIVFGTGVVTTVGFLSYSDIRSKMTKRAKEIGSIWSIMLYIPTFFPLVSARLWLAALEHKEALSSSEDNLLTTQLNDVLNEAKDWSLKAFWTETVLESKPQALLQTLILLENDRFNNIFDFLPVILSIWSMNSITSNIYELVVLNFLDTTPIFSRIYGITYTGLSILGPVMLANNVRSRFTSDFSKFLSTLIFLLCFYVVFEIIYEISYLLAKYCLVTEQKELKTSNSRHKRFMKFYQIILLILYSACVISWNILSYKKEDDNPLSYEEDYDNDYDLSSNEKTDNFTTRMVVTPIFVVLLLVNLFSCIKATDFVVEVFRLKNVKIDDAWEKLRKFTQKSQLNNPKY